MGEFTVSACHHRLQTLGEGTKFTLFNMVATSCQCGLHHEVRFKDELVYNGQLDGGVA